MCQPFAMSACKMMGTVRPETTSRAAFPPTSVHLTGLSDNAPVLRIGTTEDSKDGVVFDGLALLAATSGTRTRYALRFITLKYMTSGAIPA